MAKPKLDPEVKELRSMIKEAGKLLTKLAKVLQPTKKAKKSVK